MSMFQRLIKALSKMAILRSGYLSLLAAVLLISPDLCWSKGLGELVPVGATPSPEAGEGSESEPEEPEEAEVPQPEEAEVPQQVESEGEQEKSGNPADDLAPPSVPGEDNAIETPEVTAPKTDLTKSRVSNFLSDKLALETGFGFTSVKKDGLNWGAAGVSDLSLSFKLPAKLITWDVFATARYLPIDVAPNFHSLEPPEAYVGVLESYLLGSAVNFPINKGLVARVGLEAGVVKVDLIDTIGVLDQKTKEELGSALVMSSGIFWQWLEKVELGGMLRLGGGAFSSIQLSGQLGFAF